MSQNTELANQFFSELLDSVETLTELAEMHGPQTLADLFYLQNAILSDSFIYFYEGGCSKVLSVIETLPSSSTWTKYVQQGW